MFLYEQGPNFTPNTDALINLFKSVKAVPGIETLQTSHITMAPVVRHPILVDGVEFLQPLSGLGVMEGGEVRGHADLAAAQLTRQMHHARQVGAGMHAAGVEQ